MRIIPLVENTSAVPQCQPVHGLSLWIETAHHRLLMDAGLDCRIVSGEGHSWNLVKLADVYYYLDASLDEGKSTYSWFLNEHHLTLRTAVCLQLSAQSTIKGLICFFILF